MRERRCRHAGLRHIRRTNPGCSCDRGVTLVEYAVLLALFGAALIAAIAFVQQGLKSAFDGASSDLSAPATAAPSVTAAPSPTATTPSPDPTNTTASPTETASPTDTTSSPAAPTPLGIRWADVAFNSQPNYACDFTVPTNVRCTATSAGNRGSFSAAVEIWGREGAAGTEVAVVNPGAEAAVTQVTSGGGGSTTTSGGPMTIAEGASKTVGRYTLTLNNGQPPDTTITASVTIDGVAYQVSTVLSR